MRVTDEMVDAVEQSVSMGSGAWDMVDLKEIIAASYEAARRPSVVQGDSKCLEWARDVLDKEGRADWDIEFSPGGLEGVALFKSKVICIHWPKGEPCYPLMLHEIAHACLGVGGHDSEYAHKYMWLVHKYFEVKS